MRLKKFAWSLFRILGLVYVLLCAFLYFFQRQLIYFPLKQTPKRMESYAKALGYERWLARDGQALGWKAKGAFSTQTPRLLLFHGNGNNALGYTAFQTLWKTRQPAPAFYILEYPGYGDRTDSPSQQTILAQARKATSELLESSPAPLYLFGQSIGSGIACAMAGEFKEKIAGVLLVTPHAGLAQVAASHYPVFPILLLLKDTYPSKDWIQSYPGRVGVMIALDDEVIPARFGQELYQAIPGPKHLIEIPDASHNFWPMYADAEWFGEMWAFLTAPN